MDKTVKLGLWLAGGALTVLCLATSAAAPQITVQAYLDVKRCRTGDPLRLTVRLHGPIVPESIEPPVPAAVPGFAPFFSSNQTPVAPSGRGHDVRLVYDIRPLTPGTLEVPSLPLRVRDVSGTVRELRTPAVPVKVEPALSPGSFNDGSVRLATRHPGLGGILVTAAGAEKDAVVKPHHGILVLLGPISLLAILSACHARRVFSLPRRQRVLRRAVQEACGRLDAVRGCAASHPGRAHDVIGRAVPQVLGAAFSVTPGSMTPDDAVRLLEQAAVGPAIVEDLDRVFRNSFEARYRVDTAAGQWPEPDIDGAIKGLTRLEDHLRFRTAKHSRHTTGGPRSARPGAVALLVCVTAMGSAARASRPPPEEHVFLWNEANWIMATAHEPRSFRLAAAKYRELAARGVHNGPLFYNQAQALLAGERPSDAVAALLRAERYMGSTPGLRQSLRHARAAAQNVPCPGPAVPRSWLWWHIGLSWSLRLTVTTCAFSCMCAAFGLLYTGWARAGKYLLTASAVLLLLFGTSTLRTWHLERQCKDRVLSPGWRP